MAETPIAGDPALTPELCRAARALLGWSVDDLAGRARVGADWLAAFEQGREPAEEPASDEVERLRQALHAAEIDFLAPGEPSSGGGPGLRIRQKAGYIPTEQLSSANDV